MYVVVEVRLPVDWFDPVKPVKLPGEIDPEPPVLLLHVHDKVVAVLYAILVDAALILAPGSFTVTVVDAVLLPEELLQDIWKVVVAVRAPDVWEPVNAVDQDAPALYTVQEVAKL